MRGLRGGGGGGGGEGQNIWQSIMIAWGKSWAGQYQYITV